jgi:hypothetical protein
VKRIALAALAACAPARTPAPAAPPPVTTTPVIATPVVVQPPLDVVQQPARRFVAWMRAADGAPNFVQSVALRDDGSLLVAGGDAGSGWLAKPPPRPKRVASGSVTAIDDASETLWVRPLGTATINSVQAVANGGAIACGLYNGTLTIEGKRRATAEKGHAHLVVIALDRAGKLRWLTTASGSGDSACNDLAVLPDGSLAIVGSFGDELGLGTLAKRSLGGADAFVAVLSADGAPRWLRTGGSAQDDDARAVALAGTTIYVAGSFGANATFGDTKLALPPDPQRKVANPSNAYLARYRASGEVDWAVAHGVAGSFDAAWAVAPMSDGGAAIAGEAAEQMFVARYAPSGRQLWVRATTHQAAARALVALPDDDLLVAAYFGWPQAGHDLTLRGTTRTITLTADGSDTALAQFSATGELRAAARLAGLTPHTNNERNGSELEIFDIARAPSGRLVLAGRLWGSGVVDGGDLLAESQRNAVVSGGMGSVVVAIDPP